MNIKELLEQHGYTYSGESYMEKDPLPLFTKDGGKYDMGNHLMDISVSKLDTFILVVMAGGTKQDTVTIREIHVRMFLDDPHKYEYEFMYHKGTNLLENMTQEEAFIYLKLTRDN